MTAEMRAANPLPDDQTLGWAQSILAERAEEPDQPWFLAVGIVKPHLPFFCPEEFFELHDATMGMPENP